MSKSPNIGLTLTPSSDNEKKFLAFRTEIAGDSDESNMMILDKEIAALKAQYGVLVTQITWGHLKNGLSSNAT